MIKKLFTICVLISCLNAEVQERPMATQLEMFLFKIGFTSLVADVNNEKNITKMNSTDIKQLQADVQYILKMLNKDKLNNNEGVESQVIINQEEKFSNIVTVKVEEAYVRSAPYLDANISKTLHLGDTVEIEFCNKYDWCKIKGDYQYIAKYLLNGFK